MTPLDFSLAYRASVGFFAIFKTLLRNVWEAFSDPYHLFQMQTIHQPLGSPHTGEPSMWGLCSSLQGLNLKLVPRISRRAETQTWASCVHLQNA